MSPNLWLRHTPPHWEKAVFRGAPQGRAAAKGQPGTVSRRLVGRLACNGTPGRAAGPHAQLLLRLCSKLFAGTVVTAGACRRVRGPLGYHCSPPHLRRRLLGCSRSRRSATNPACALPVVEAKGGALVVGLQAGS